MGFLTDKIPQTAQGEAKPATAEDLEKDAFGITDPNLHRRIDNENTPTKESELRPSTYTLSVSGLNSFRTTKHTVHLDNPEEDDPEIEIP